MVKAAQDCGLVRERFQYSLCRVVLMVRFFLHEWHQYTSLSVLALSSRFDGRCD